ncbi:hypothetical protein ACNOYE_32270 [Nannocystaceae bacterium ST9]
MSDTLPEDPDDRDDELVLALVRRAREQESESSATPWEAVVRGEQSVEAVAADEGADLERARAYFRPFDAGETRAIVDRVLADTPRAAEVVPMRGRERKRSEWVIGGVLLAMAAAAALWWAWPRSPGEGSGGQEIAVAEPIPAYGLEVGGWLKTERDPTAPTPDRYRYRSDTPFEWILRPQAEVAGELALRAFVLDPDGVGGRPLDLGELAQIADTGSIRIRGTIGQLNLAPGHHTIALAIGRPDALPERAEALAESGERAWRAFRIELDVVASPSGSP